MKNIRTKFYSLKENQDRLDLKKKFYVPVSNSCIVFEENGLITAGIDFEITDRIIIERMLIDTDINGFIFKSLFSKLLFVNYLNKDILIKKDDFKKYKDYLFIFTYLEIDNYFLLKLTNYKRRRFVEVGSIKTGKLNNLCDVPGVKVGHFSINNQDTNTGITAILPHERNIFKEKLIAASYVYNGFTKCIGLTQIDELGTLETPILLTNTLNVGKVSEGLVDHVLEDNPEIGVSTSTVNPVVLECNDGTLNDIRNRHLDSNSVKKAIDAANSDYLDGNIGAGSGMTCHGFKGGIGSASRVIKLDNKEYTLGILVNSNFLGSTPKYLRINNHFIGDKFDRQQDIADKGSITIVFATDIPLSERQLKRILKRSVLGIGRTGGFAGNGSGDVVVGFSTANIIDHYNKNTFSNLVTLNDNSIDLVFRATVDATEEAILNSLFNSKTVVGVRGNKSQSINEFIEIFDHLLINSIFED